MSTLLLDAEALGLEFVHRHVGLERFADAVPVAIGSGRR